MAEQLHIAVIGAGLMGAGIAQVFAQAGHRVSVYDVDRKALDRLPENVTANLSILSLDHGCLSLITAEPDFDKSVGDADVVIEAVSEKLKLKRSIFAQLAEKARSDAILASNTSVIPITSIAEGNPAAKRILGTHWWNPPYLIPIVEVVQAEKTDPGHVRKMATLLKQCGKIPVIVKKDVPGFVGNRLQHALWREAISLVENGVCDAETVDLVAKNTFGLRMPVLGPLENADLVGLDLTIDIHKNILPHLSCADAPAQILYDKVERGDVGVKSGHGLRDWTPEEIAEIRARLLNHLRKAIQ